MAKEEQIQKVEVSQEISATVENQYHYEKCCADENGEFDIRDK